MFTTPHAKMRFLERVETKPPNRGKKKFIEEYIKKAFKKGLEPKDIQDKELQSYMIHKLRNDNHHIKANKITLYKNNLFLFINKQCITILDVPESSSGKILGNVHITNINKFIKSLNENNYIKNWLYRHSKNLQNTGTEKRINIELDNNLTYSRLMNNVPLRAIKYINNDSKLKKIIIKTNKNREKYLRKAYYRLMTLMLLIPKSKILKFCELLNDNKLKPIVLINNKDVTKKQVDICYKQLVILLGEEPKCKYDKFKLSDDNLIMIYYFLQSEIRDNINQIYTLFEEKEIL